MNSELTCLMENKYTLECMHTLTIDRVLNKLNITLVSFVTHLLLNEMHFPSINLSSHDSGVSDKKLGSETSYTASGVKSASSGKKKFRSLIVSHCFKTKHCSKKRKQLLISVSCWWCRQMVGIIQHVIDSLAGS